MFTCLCVDLVAVALANNLQPLTVRGCLSAPHVDVIAHAVATVTLQLWIYNLNKDVYSKCIRKVVLSYGTTFLIIN